MGLRSGLVVGGVGSGGGGVAPVSPRLVAGCVWLTDVADATTVVAGGRVTSLRNLAPVLPPPAAFVPNAVGPLYLARGIGGQPDMVWDGATTALVSNAALLASTAFTIGCLVEIEENQGVVFGGGDFFGVTYNIELASLGAIRVTAGDPNAGGAEAITRAKFLDGKTHIIQARWDSLDGAGHVEIQVDGAVAPLITDTPSTNPMVTAGDSNSIGASCHGAAGAAWFQGQSPAAWLINRSVDAATLAGMLAWARARGGIT